jgi:hypothetical protein
MKELGSGTYIQDEDGNLTEITEEEVREQNLRAINAVEINKEEE